MTPIIFIILVLLIIFIYNYKNFYNNKITTTKTTKSNIQQYQKILNINNCQKICNTINKNWKVLNTINKTHNNNHYLLLNVHDISDDVQRIVKIKYIIIDDGVKVEDVRYVNNMNVVGHSFKSASEDEKGLLSLLEPALPEFSESVPGWSDQFQMVVGDNSPCIQWSEFRDKEITPIPNIDYYIPNLFKIYNESPTSMFSLFQNNLGISNTPGGKSSNN